MSDQATDAYYERLFGGGLDHVDDALSPDGRSTLQGMLAGSDNPADDKARMVNLGYAQTHVQGHDPDELAQNWDAYRDEFASSLAGTKMQHVSDTQLFGVIQKHVQKQAAERTMLGHLGNSLLESAMEGEQSYLPTLDRMRQQMQSDPGYDPKHADEYLFAAKAMWKQAQDNAVRVAPVARLAADYFRSQHGDQYPSAGQEDSVVAALQALSPEERQMALNAAGAAAHRSLAAQEQASGDKPGTMDAVGRGLGQLVGGAVREGQRAVGLLEQGMAGFGTAIPGQPSMQTLAPNEQGVADSQGQKLTEEATIRGQLEQTFNETADPIGTGRAQKAWYGFAQQFPTLASTVLNPMVGVPLFLGSAADQSTTALAARGVDPQHAAVGGMIAAAPMAAALKLQGSVLAGESMAWLGKFAANLGARVVGRSLQNAAVINVAQAFQDAAVPGTQAILHQLDQAVPDIDWKKEAKDLANTRLDTFINLLPLLVVGTGAAAFRESAYMRNYTSQLDLLKTAGLSEEEAKSIASAPDANEATVRLRQAFQGRDPASPGARAAAARVDAQSAEAADAAAQQSVSRPALTFHRNPQGEFDIYTDAGEHLGSVPTLEAYGQFWHDWMTAPDELPRTGEETGQEGAASPEETLRQGLSTLEPSNAPAVAEATRLRPDMGSGGMRPGFVSVPSIPGIPGSNWLAGAGRRAMDLIKSAAAAPAMSPFKQALNGLVGRLQRNSMEVRRLIATIQELVPSAAEREGITNYLQAAGDLTKLQAWEASSKGARQAGYAAAQKLSPNALKAADMIRKFYDDMLVKLKGQGLLEDGITNYVNQIWAKDLGPDVPPSAQLGGKLQDVFHPSKQRTFGSFFEGEQLDYVPLTKDISKLVGIYLNEANKVMATREFVKSLTTLKGSDGRPLAAPTTSGVVKAEEQPGPSFIKADVKPEDAHDYEVIPHRSLRGWRWSGVGPNDEPVMHEGDLAIHPEAAQFVNAIIGRDRYRDWLNKPSTPVMNVVKGGLKTVETVSGAAKGLMFNLSGYHQLQETVRALGYRINPFSNLPELDPKAPEIQRSTAAGLMLAGDRDGIAQFMDGFQTGNAFSKIPVVGSLAHRYTEWLFHDYIPQLKQKTWESVVERNTDRYADDLKSGKITQQAVDYLSAQQVNAAYGHLNYADLGRSPTARHLSRLVLLAPDFLESTAKTAGQAAKGVIGNRAGAEQLTQLAFLALTQWVTARVLNKTIDGDFHNEEPFGVVHNGRVYSIRSIPEDIVSLAKDPWQFAMSRVSPMVNQGVEMGSGKNYRGEKVPIDDRLRDLATSFVPMALRGPATHVPGIRYLIRSQTNGAVSPWEEFITSQGLRISRHSQINEAFALAQQYNRAHNVPADAGVYPVSQFQQLRYALEDGRTDAAEAEWKELQANARDKRGKPENPAKLARGFKEGLFRPWTGSKQGDFDFKHQLDDSGKQTIAAAEAKRLETWHRFVALAHPGGHSAPDASEGESPASESD